MAVTVQVDDHPRETRPYVLRDIADRLRVPRQQIAEVLGEWTADQLREHLESLPAAELKPPALRHR